MRKLLQVCSVGCLMALVVPAWSADKYPKRDEAKSAQKGGVSATYIPAGHVLGTVGADPFDDGIGTGVADGICPATELPLETVRPNGVAIALAGVQSAVESPSRAGSGAR